MKVQITINPVDIFEDELECFNSDMAVEIVIKAIHKIPQYFWTAPASSSGKYHPKTSLGLSGLIRHTKSVFWIGEELLKHPMYGAPFSDYQKDCIRAAELLHDGVKQGINAEGEHTVTEHPLLVRATLRPWEDKEWVSVEMCDMWSDICNLIETHMGVWTKNKEGKEVLKVPETEAQKFVHMADYLASRPTIEVDTTDRKPQANYPTKKATNDAWRNDPAKDSQIDYIKGLILKCSARGMGTEPIDFTTLTKGTASDWIQTLKKVLGEE